MINQRKVETNTGIHWWHIDLLLIVSPLLLRRRRLLTRRTCWSWTIDHDEDTDMAKPEIPVWDVIMVGRVSTPPVILYVQPINRTNKDQNKFWRDQWRAMCNKVHLDKIIQQLSWRSKLVCTVFQYDTKVPITEMTMKDGGSEQCGLLESLPNNWNVL